MGMALRRKGFTASDSSVLSCAYCKQGDFDRTAQIVRLRDGVIPSIFSFPVHLQRVASSSPITTILKTVNPTPYSSAMVGIDVCEVKHHSNHVHPSFYQDHGYALPASPTALKTRLNEATARVESLEREKMNAMAREKRAKTTVKSLLGGLREKNLINEELKERLELYSDQAEYGCTALILDNIRKHVQYNPHTQSMSGCVDMDDGNRETDVATELK
uniref:Uncharacterized protein n=1 Tax=Echeneis naucrates TaxID=173247 RepID=A0A665T471_ECHNA